MANEKELPTYRCSYCLQALTEDDRQHLFGSGGLCPKSDEAENFITETQTILRYASAVATMCNAAEKIGEEVVYQLHHLVGELTEEALRRLALAQEALEVVWDREQAAKKAPHAQKEGRV